MKCASFDTDRTVRHRQRGRRHRRRLLRRAGERRDAGGLRVVRGRDLLRGPGAPRASGRPDIPAASDRGHCPASGVNRVSRRYAPIRFTGPSCQARQAVARTLMRVTEAVLNSEDQKIITLARSTRARVAASEGAAVRDETGRTYTAAAVALPSPPLSALRVAVAMGVSSGALRLEGAARASSAARPDPADL